MGDLTYMGWDHPPCTSQPVMAAATCFPNFRAILFKPGTATVNIQQIQWMLEELQ